MCLQEVVPGEPDTAFGRSAGHHGDLGGQHRPVRGRECGICFGSGKGSLGKICLALHQRGSTEESVSRAAPGVRETPGAELGTRLCFSRCTAQMPWKILPKAKLLLLTPRSSNPVQTLFPIAEWPVQGRSMCLVSAVKALASKLPGLTQRRAMLPHVNSSCCCSSA